MKKIPLEIVSLTQSITQSHSYAVVLEEVNGRRRLPIVIGGFEAQAIAVAIEKMHTGRPLTHDLFKNVFDTFNIELLDIIISNLKEGIFYALLICKIGDSVVEIDSRTSDAIALAVRFNCPIFTYEEILSQAGILLEDQITSGENPPAKEKEKVEVKTEEVTLEDTKHLSKLSEKQLSELLSLVLKNEEYEKAVRIRDEIETRKKNS